MQARTFGGLSFALLQSLPNGATVEMRRSHVFCFDELAVRKNSNGSESRNVLHGELPTGEQVAVHESTQPARIAPSPAHRIDHTEMICMREGTLEFRHDGITERAAAGDVLFVAKGTMHGVRNVGDGPAAYFVVAIGGDTNQKQ